MMERAFDAGKAHEVRSKSMFTDPDSGILRVLRAHSITESQILEARNLLDFHEIPFLHDIISSSLDADRMDYLLRDSHFTGVAYGNYDLDWILNSFCLGLDPNPAQDGDKTKLRLCLDDRRGQFAAEQLIIARVHMTMQVYTHRTTRMWEAHLLLLFAEATRLAESGDLPAETPAFVARYFERKGAVCHKDFLMIDEPSLITSITIWSEEVDSEGKLKELSEAFLRREKVLKCRDLPGEQGTLAKLSQLRKKLDSKAGPEGAGWLIDRYDFAAYKMPRSEQRNSDPKSFWEAISKDSIMLATGELTEKAFPIQQDSNLIASLGVAKTPVCRLFFLPELEAAVKSST